MIQAVRTLCGNCKCLGLTVEQNLPLGTSSLQHGNCQKAQRPDFAPEDWPLVTVYEKCNEFQPKGGTANHV